MQVVIKSTSSKIAKYTYLIQTTVEIGDQRTTSQEAYDAQMLMDNRFMSGTLEERVEALRLSAQNVTEKTVKQHFERLAKAAEPKVFEVQDAVTEGLRESLLEAAVATPAKKPRAPRKAKTTV
jgi:hypothetical protein